MRLLDGGFAAELDGHFEAAVGDGAGADDFAGVGDLAVAASAGHFDEDFLADGEGLAEEEGDAGLGEVAGEDFVDLSLLEAVLDADDGLCKYRPAEVFPTVVNGRGGRGT